MTFSVCDISTSAGLPWNSGKVVCWFSCGAASAVAAKFALEKYPHASVCYTDPGGEHPDNDRFLVDCENWLGRKIRVLKSTEYKDPHEVCEKARFLSSPEGAPCTAAMKKIPARLAWGMGDVEIFGYTVEELDRVERWKTENFDRFIECPLIEHGMTKDDCFTVLTDAGIQLPLMYRLGFRNNNCIGCVKARDNLDYWKRVRKFFPAHFERVARIEADLGYTINRITRNGKKIGVPLYDLPPGDPKGADPKISCGLFCGTDDDEVN